MRGQDLALLHAAVTRGHKFVEAVREAWVPLAEPKPASKWAAALRAVAALSAPAAFSAQSAQALVPVAAGATVGAEPAPVAVAVGQDGTAGESPALADIRIDVDSFILDFSRTVINVASSRAAASATAGMEGQLKGALDGSTQLPRIRRHLIKGSRFSRKTVKKLTQ